MRKYATPIIEVLFAAVQAWFAVEAYRRHEWLAAGLAVLLALWMLYSAWSDVPRRT
jgi:hypothetical protein